MATLRDIRRRIASVKSTQQITKAMKMVAAAKLRRAQERVVNARPYAERLDALVRQIAGIDNIAVHPLFEKRDLRKETIVIVSGDRGLCGSFNANVIKKARQVLDALPSADVGEIIAIGRKGEEFFRRRNYAIVQRYINIFHELSFAVVREISDFIHNRFLSAATDRVVVVYNGFKSVGAQEIRMTQLLPVTPEASDMDAASHSDYIYEPDAVTILNDIVPKNLDTQLWRIILESNASEQAARMVAMDAATENAEEMINDLTLHYNKARQAAITKEISEIVGGAEALRG